jgi:MoxR-like ATPase
MEIMDRMAGQKPAAVQPVLEPQDILRSREVVRQIYVDDKVKQYIVNLVCATREPQAYGLANMKNLVRYGASPRATINLNVAARAHAFLKGRGYVTPDDVKAIGTDVLRHRVIPTYEAEAEEKTSEDLVRMVFEGVEVP